MTEHESTLAGQATTEALAPYANFRFRAVVDWIELRIVTTLPTNFDTVRRRLGVPHAKPLNPGTGGAATEFVFRIQEPSSWASINQILERFTVDHPLVEPVEVTAIEIALDAYSRKNCRDDLVQMTAKFFKFTSKLVSSNRRISRGKFETEGISGYRNLHRRLHDGWNIYIGDRGASVRQHMYVKETSQVDGESVSLPLEECRSRSEFTLQKEALPHRALSDWKQHDFTAHADFFKYRMLKPHLNPWAAKGASQQDQIGERRTRSRLGRGTRLFSKSTVADSQLNALSYSALRELTKRMKA